MLTKARFVSCPIDHVIKYVVVTYPNAWDPKLYNMTRPISKYNNILFTEQKCSSPIFARAGYICTYSYGRTPSNHIIQIYCLVTQYPKHTRTKNCTRGLCTKQYQRKFIRVWNLTLGPKYDPFVYRKGGNRCIGPVPIDPYVTSQQTLTTLHSDQQDII
jgi:hypothetical protein